MAEGQPTDGEGYLLSKDQGSDHDDYKHLVDDDHHLHVPYDEDDQYHHHHSMWLKAKPGMLKDLHAPRIKAVIMMTTNI